MIGYILVHYKNHTVIEIGTISALFMYLSNLSRVFFGFGGLYSKLIQHKTDIGNVYEIENASAGNTKKITNISFETLEIKKLNFLYKNSKLKALNDINFIVKS